jgi:hypothetical protein
MPSTTVHRRPPASSEDSDRRELLERIERLQQRIDALAAASEAADAEVRRQRAAGRRP